ncbi:hypothetical protein [Roseospira navarrensis]|uniref:Uncharacterized protein n=1 Tax=Roseospira navarrensis TaxID=140058 RepID=A0A7X1ZE33_9PROT|nr:hypothetical protein [Roseospira navarrensis]MQX35881.1 hypothetical protein [Roseospira navarrensis]
MKENKIVRISLSGGLIGVLTTNPRATLERRIQEENRAGWSAIYFSAHRDTNVFIAMLQIVVLFITFFLWTWGAGYLVLLEREQPS